MQDTADWKNLDWVSATLASDAMEGRNVLPFGIHTLNPGWRVIGPAFVALGSQDDNQVVRRIAAEPPAAPCVLVVSGHSQSRTATIGDLMALELKNAGFLGLVTDGLVRDSQEIRQLDFPVWCRGTTPIASAKNNPGVIGSPIMMGNALIREGDWVIADGDGVVVWPKEEIDQLIGKAKAKLEADQARLERLLSAKK